MAGVCRDLVFFLVISGLFINGHGKRSIVGRISSHSKPSHLSHRYPASSSGLSGTTISKPSLSGSGSNSYPSSSWFSGNRQSGSLSGSSAHGYPSTNGLSGSGHSGSSSGSSYPRHRPHVYPSTNGLSGSGHSGSSWSNPGAYPKPVYTGSSNAHVYPSHNGLSGSGSSWHSSSSSHGYKYPGNGNYHSGSSWSVNKPSSYHNTHNNYHLTTRVHHHYYYHPPRAIYYGGYHHSYPVYTSQLPMYVYEYRSSDNRYRQLLSGWALYNLGHTTSNTRFHNYHTNYRPHSNEVCKFGVRYDSANYEEMGIDCRLITNFFWEEDASEDRNVPPVASVVTKTQTVITTTNTTNNNIPGQTISNNSIDTFITKNVNGNVQAVPPTQMKNITMNETSPIVSSIPNNIHQIPKNGTATMSNIITTTNSSVANANVTETGSVDKPVSQASLNKSAINETLATNTNISVAEEITIKDTSSSFIALAQTVSSSITTTTISEVVSAMDSRYNGAPVQITKGMECYVTRKTPWSSLRKSVSCGLLEAYSTQSLQSLSFKIGPSFSMIVISVVFLFL